MKIEPSIVTCITISFSRFLSSTVFPRYKAWSPDDVCNEHLDCHHDQGMNEGTRIGIGRTAELRVLESGKIVKLFFDDVPRYAIKREHENAIFVNNFSIQTPHVHDMITVDGRAGIVYEFIEGETMIHKVLRRPWHFRHDARLLAELHANIHEIAADGLPLQRDRLQRRIRGATMLSRETRSRVLAYLGTLQDGGKLCHGDFHPDNVMISPQGPVIIDWMGASCGNPLSDVANTLLLLQAPSKAPGRSILMNLLVLLFRKAFCSEYIKQYMKITGTKRTLVDEWMVVAAAAKLHDRVPGEQDWLVKIVKTQLKKRHVVKKHEEE